jgi:hypothetical protein
LVFGGITVAGQRRGSVFLSVAESDFSMIGEDGAVLSLSEVQSTRREDLLYGSFRILGCQVKDGFEETLE